MESISVMIVEDDFMVADINRQVVEQIDGFSVVTMARTGSEALTAMEKGGIDLVILDIYLPDIQGIAVLKEARRREFNIDFILITAAHDARTVEDSMRYGVFDFIIKPFDLERYRQALEEYRQRRTVLAEDSFPTQSKLDEALSREAPRRSELPKGISEQTLAKVSDFLGSVENEVSSSDLVDRMKLSRVTAHRYLEYLGQIGHLKKEVRYQKVGRPIVVYLKRNGRTNGSIL